MSRPKFTIVTACKRPKNIPLLEATIKPGKQLFDITWYIVLDTLHADGTLMHTPDKAIVLETQNENSVGGNAQRNLALTHITDGWVYFVDDDTTVHPNFWRRIRQAIEANPTAGAIVVGQDIWGSYRPARPDFVKKDFIDTSQFVLKRGLIGDLQWPTTLYQSDAYIIEHVYKQHYKRFCFINEPLSFYNRLRPGERQ